MKSFRCYKSFAAAIAAATHNAVRLPPDASPQSVTDADLAPALGVPPYALIGTDYDGTYYHGDSLTWIAYGLFPGGPCSTSQHYRRNTPSYFNNRLSSTRGFNHCNGDFSYDGYNQTGAVLHCRGGCVTAGVMNNRTSSKDWWRGL